MIPYGAQGLDKGAGQVLNLFYTQRDKTCAVYNSQKTETEPELLTIKRGKTLRNPPGLSYGVGTTNDDIEAINRQ